MRQMNRLEVVGEAMRLVLDDLAVVAPKVYERIKKRSGYHAMGVRLTCIVFPRAKPSRYPGGGSWQERLLAAGEYSGVRYAGGSQGLPSLQVLS